ncbi:protein YgfX [Phytopseudomonas punonensis]|uniref:protein YgfX n=1 Tax=Phytopseudomonas punonensis TaxID=1220495 RepID=UPI0009342CC8|nr:protein YgfX [Pseudomonas punonensis]
MSSPSKRFECSWRPSRRLLEVYLCAQALALLTLVLVELPLWAKLVCVLACGCHAAWVLPRDVLLSRADTVRALRHDDDGWQVRCAEGQWQAITLQPDSMALPWLVIVRFRLPGRYLARSLVIPSDSLPRDVHRRLRVYLKFSRQRWRVAE